MTDFDRQITALSDADATALLSDVAEYWLASNPRQGLDAMRKTDAYTFRGEFKVPDWITDPSKNSEQAGKLARSALAVLVVDGTELEKKFLVDRLSRPAQVKAYAIDPVTGTLCLMGLILAARIKKIGPNGIEFYEGVPEGLAKVLKAGSSFFGNLEG